MIPPAEVGADAPHCRLAMSFRLHLFASGDLMSVEFLDVREFADAKESAVTAVSTCTAARMELHDETAGLVFRYPELLS